MIADWARKRGKAVSEVKEGQKKTIEYVTQFQDLGDALRKEAADLAAVAKALAVQIRSERASKLKLNVSPGDVVHPDGNFRAYVLDSLRHPAEV